jgi:hypothetical protein
LKRISKESEKNQSSTDDEEEVEDDHDGSNIEGWYGIKQGQGSREQQRLFVADRRLSKTEKVPYIMNHDTYILYLLTTSCSF